MPTLAYVRDLVEAVQTCAQLGDDDSRALARRLGAMVPIDWRTAPPTLSRDLLADCGSCGGNRSLAALRVYISHAGESAELRCSRCDVCADCSDGFENPDGRHAAERHTTVDGDVICESCAGDSYVYSTLQEGYLNSDAACSVEGEEYASRRWLDRHGYYEHADGIWRSEPEESEDDDDDESEDTLCLYPYRENVLDHCAHDRAAIRRGELLFGVELEMEARRISSQSEIVSVLGGKCRQRFILKEDGSLTRGVELVTVPLTLTQHTSEFGWKATLAPILALAQSGAGTESCGIHIHINRRALSALTVGKLLVFLNSPANVGLVDTVGQRSSNGYCQRIPKKVGDGLCRRVGTRYELVNVTRRDTVEIRLFRGNLRAERILKNIEFVHALALYLPGCSARDCEDPQRFGAWVGARPKDYPHLHEFLVGAGWINLTRPPHLQYCGADV